MITAAVLRDIRDRDRVTRTRPRAPSVAQQDRRDLLAEVDRLQRITDRQMFHILDMQRELAEAKAVTGAEMDA